MAYRYARKTGNWNASDVWSDTPTGSASASFIPVSGDIAVANGFTITINQDITVDKLMNMSINSSTAGGGFTCSIPATINSDIVSASTAALLTLNNNSGTITINAPNEISTLTHQAITNNGLGLIVINTNNIINLLTGNASLSTLSMLTGVSIINCNNVYGGYTGFAGGSPSIILGYAVSATVNVKDTIYSNVGQGIYLSSVNSLSKIIINANRIISTNSSGITIYSSTCSATINCNAIIGSDIITTGYGVLYSSSSNTKLFVNGNVYAGKQGPGIYNGGVLILNGTAIGNDYGVGSVGYGATYAIVNATQTAITKVKNIRFGSRGQSPLNGPNFFLLSNPTENVVSIPVSGNGKYISMSNPNSLANSHAAPNNVRNGVVYANNALSGTMKIPATNQVSVGIPVDNSVGTSVVNADQLKAIVGNIITSLN